MSIVMKLVILAVVIVTELTVAAILAGRFTEQNRPILAMAIAGQALATIAILGAVLFFVL